MLGYITLGTLGLGTTSRFYDSLFSEINIDDYMVDSKETGRKEQ